MDIIHFFDIPRIHPKCIHRDHFRTNETSFDDFSLMAKDTNVTTLIYKKIGMTIGDNNSQPKRHPVIH